MTTTCLECGKQTEREPCFANRKFCNRQCSTRFNNRAKQKREVKVCPTCNVEFESLTCQQRHGRGKYCSRECANIGKKVTTSLVCEWCGGQYERHTCKASQSRYCGNACKALAGAERQAQREMGRKEYDRRFEEQGGLCAICRKPEIQVWRKGAIKVIKLTKDHDHKTGEWRGLLCRKCNMALGLLGDDAGLLLRAAEYVVRGGWVDADEQDLLV